MIFQNVLSYNNKVIVLQLAAVLKLSIHTYCSSLHNLHMLKGASMS